MLIDLRKKIFWRVFFKTILIKTCISMSGIYANWHLYFTFILEKVLEILKTSVSCSDSVRWYLPLPHRKAVRAMCAHPSPVCEGPSAPVGLNCPDQGPPCSTCCPRLHFSLFLVLSRLCQMVMWQGRNLCLKLRSCLETSALFSLRMSSCAAHFLTLTKFCYQ